MVKTITLRRWQIQLIDAESDNRSGFINRIIEGRTPHRADIPDELDNTLWPVSVNLSDASMGLVRDGNISNNIRNRISIWAGVGV